MAVVTTDILPDFELHLEEVLLREQIAGI